MKLIPTLLIGTGIYLLGYWRGGRYVASHASTYLNIGAERLWWAMVGGFVLIGLGAATAYGGLPQMPPAFAPGSEVVYVREWRDYDEFGEETHTYHFEGIQAVVTKVVWKNQRLGYMLQLTTDHDGWHTYVHRNNVWTRAAYDKRVKELEKQYGRVPKVFGISILEIPPRDVPL